jgi:hypothetical protein
LAQVSRARLTAREGRTFGLTVGLAFLALSALLWWRDHHSVAIAVATVGGLLAIAGVVIPRHLGPVHAAWMGFALAISKVTTPVLMAIVYFLVITPTALLRRALGKNALVAQRGGSQWVSRAEQPRSDLRRQF